MLTALIFGDSSQAVEQALFTSILGDDRGMTPYVTRIGCGSEVTLDVLRQFTCVFVLPGNPFPALPRDTQRALADYVREGGVLVCMPFTAWSAQHYGHDHLQNILPVRCTSYFERQTVRLQKTAIRLPKGMASSTLPGYTFIASGEDVELVNGSEVICLCKTRGKTMPFLARRRSGCGYVLYLNVSHRSRTGDLRIWYTGGTFDTTKRSPIYDLLSAWLFRCIPDEARVKRGSMMERVSQVAATYLLDSSNQHKTDNMGQEILFPELPQYLGLTESERNAVCRASLTLSPIRLGPRGVRADSLRNQRIEVSNDIKKRYLERLASYFFLLVPNIAIARMGQRAPLSDFGVVLRNHSRDAFWLQLGELIAVECSGWEKSAGVKEFVGFYEGLLELGLDTGFFVTIGGFARDSSQDLGGLLRDFRKEGVVIAPIDLEVIRHALKLLDPTAAIRQAYERSAHGSSPQDLVQRAGYGSASEALRGGS